MSDAKEFDVFLSHNSNDKELVEKIADHLVADGLKPWFDKWHLVPGTPWQPAIEAAINASRTCVVFVGASGFGPWHNEEMRSAIADQVDRRRADFRVFLVLLPGAKRGQKSQLPAFLKHRTWVDFRNTIDYQEALRKLCRGIRGLPPGRELDKPIIEGVCPYRGIQFFDIEHAPFFFGRESLTEWLLNDIGPSRSDVKSRRFLGIVGASGSGKSSLARAGMIAAIKRGNLPDSDKWPSRRLQAKLRPTRKFSSSFVQSHQ